MNTAQCMMMVSFLLSVQPVGAASLNVSNPDLLSVNAEVGELKAAKTIATASGELAQVEQQRFVTQFPGMNPEQAPLELQGVRTVAIVAGRHPYRLLMEDYSDLGAPALVERGFPTPEGMALAGFDYDEGGNDILLKGVDQPVAALRILRTRATKTKLPPGMRIGGPAMVVDGALSQSTLIIPAYTDRPSFRLLFVDDARDAPVCKWLEGGKVLQVEWHDQIDVFTFDTDPAGLTKFLLERRRGLNRDEVISFGLPYVPEEPATGNLIAHWSFEDVTDRKVPDVSGHGFDAEMQGGLRLTSGVLGHGIDGVSCEGVRAGELVIPTLEGELPGKLEFGQLALPAAAFQSIKDNMTLSFWYAMPPIVNGAYHPYMPYWKSVEPRAQFEVKGLKLYSYDHWMNGHCITAAGLGNQRLFGMIGPKQPRDMWNHYAVVIDGTEARLYINGDLQMQQTGKESLDGVINLTNMGAALKNTWARMDEIRLYDYPLSLEEIEQQFRQDGQGLLSRLTFEEATLGEIPVGVIRDQAGNEFEAENITIVPRDGGKAVQFAEEGGSINFPDSITQGKHIDAVTFAAWVRLPKGYKGREYLLSSGNHGHMGMFVGFSGGNLWGKASQNPFKGRVTPGQWTHVVCSYGHNRIRTYINGEKVQDEDNAYPGSKGFGVGPLSLSYNAGLVLDDVQLFSFALTDEQASQVMEGGTDLRPAQGTRQQKVRRVITALEH